MNIGQAIKEARKNRGYTLKKLAAKSGITYTTINYWENGRGYPNLVPLMAVADALGISLDELVGRTVPR